MDARLSRSSQVNAIEAADCKGQDELEEAQDAKGDERHRRVEESHFDSVPSYFILYLLLLSPFIVNCGCNLYFRIVSLRSFHWRQRL